MEIVSKNKHGRLKFTIGWIFFGVCLISLLIYGLSFFITNPTVETITINAAGSTNSRGNAGLTHDVKFQSKEKFRRR